VPVVWSGVVRFYRGCMQTFLLLFVGAFSLLLSRGLGLVGLLLPWVLLGATYLFIEALIIELLYWDHDRSQDYWRE
jgi:hypothetical protein